MALFGIIFGPKGRLSIGIEYKVAKRRETLMSGSQFMIGQNR